MANYRGPKAKISRVFHEPILGCEKVLARKNYPPGMHGRKRKRKSDYALQLEQKQKARHTYQVLEKQFRRIVRKAINAEGLSGHVLMQLLEMRLVTIVFRLGISPTMRAARQLVAHRHIYVNDKCVDRPSYTLKKGEKVSLAPKAKKMQVVKKSLTHREGMYPWLAWEPVKMEGVILEIPARTIIPGEINDRTIIEYYSK